MTKKFVLQLDQTDRNVTMDRVRRYVETLPLDKPYEIVIDKLVRKRSNLQNRALWGCAYKAITFGTDKQPEDVHDAMCMSFFGSKHVEIGGQVIARPLRTTTHDAAGSRDVISVDLCAEFYAHIQAVMADFGIHVPDPDPNWFKKDLRGAA